MKNAKYDVENSINMPKVKGHYDFDQADFLHGVANQLPGTDIALQQTKTDALVQMVKRPFEKIAQRFLPVEQIDSDNTALQVALIQNDQVPAPMMRGLIKLSIEDNGIFRLNKAYKIPLPSISIIPRLIVFTILVTIVSMRIPEDIGKIILLSYATLVGVILPPFILTCRNLARIKIKKSMRRYLDTLVQRTRDYVDRDLDANKYNAEPSPLMNEIDEAWSTISQTPNNITYHTAAALLALKETFAENCKMTEQNKRSDMYQHVVSLSAIICRKAKKDHISQFDQAESGFDILKKKLARIVDNYTQPKALPHNVIKTGRGRIDRIAATARKVLQENPNLTDSQGSSIKKLIDEHLPRLMHAHANAIADAPVEEIDMIDAKLDEGVEHIRQSVEEGIAAMQSEKMDSFLVEIRFLELRRGAKTTLRAVN